MTLVQKAVAVGNHEITRYLLTELRLNPNTVSKRLYLVHSFVRGYKRCCPLKVACMKNDLTAIRMLLEHGADPNTRDHYGETPFTCLCSIREGNTLPALEEMVKHGARNVRDTSARWFHRSLRTPLSCAVMADRLDVVMFLSQKGFLKDRNMAAQCYSLALHHNKLQIAEYLKRRGCDKGRGPEWFWKNLPVESNVVEEDDTDLVYSLKYSALYTNARVKPPRDHRRPAPTRKTGLSSPSITMPNGSFSLTPQPVSTKSYADVLAGR
eukprot:TRINITY_DN5949_c0_g2_i1.p1 TRINITY_DN5949_c0_g2~~TRINITY_DN5949_c0_g2_i1.p1  ORF type:complete len:312 (+),score=62.31 TRINITY_DN5949_c0_g2_i1:136-936(+)